MFYRSPDDQYPTIVRGKDCLLWDDAGNEYLDLTSGISTTAGIGHSRADIAAAMAAQATRLSFIHSSRVTNDQQEALARRLVDVAPEGIDRAMFTSGGSEANELALRITRQYHLARGEPQRWKIISLAPSYHGATLGAMAMSGGWRVRKDYDPYLMSVSRVTAPITYRGPWAGFPDSETGVRAADAIADTIEAIGPSSVAAFIGEPIAGTAGWAIPPEGYWRRVREICDHYGILMIADEIVTGAGRTGTFLSMEQFEAVPDITNLAKGLSGGYVPLGATLIRDEVADTIGSQNRRMSEVHTFSGAPISCAIGLAVLDVIEGEGLVAAAAEKGALLGSLLKRHILDLPVVGEIRGLGLMWAVEYVRSKETREMYPADADIGPSLWKAMWDRGFLLTTARFDGRLVGDCTLFAPPLIIDESDLERSVLALRDAIEEQYPTWG